MSFFQPQGMGRQFSRELSGGSGGGQEFIDFTPKYVWGGGGGGGGGQKVKKKEVLSNNALTLSTE